MMKFMAEQERLRDLLEMEQVPKAIYREVLTKHQELMIKLINDIEARKEKATNETIENLRNKVLALESFTQQAPLPLQPNRYYS